MIYFHKVHKRFGSRELLNEAGFHLRPNERVGLVGPNGAGKTTLFRIVAGEEPVDSGTVTLRKGARVARLTQELETGEESILERAVMGDRAYREVKQNLESLENDSRLREEEPEKWSRRYGRLHHEFERLGGYHREARAAEILSGLGFQAHQMRQPLAKFSGGWRMRVELAQLLLQNPDVLLLDEPTNHLDLHSVVWLEAFLKTCEGAVMIISHDRRFLNNLVDRVMELDRGTLTAYAGNYDDFERLKAERETQLEAAAANQQRRVAEIERFIERFRAKNTKATQVQSRIKMLGKMKRVETATRGKTVNFRFPQPARAARVSIELRNVHMSYGPVRVYENFSIHLERGWKVALVGENGAGKSTLLKLMAGVLEPGAGTVPLGANVTRAYFAQHHAETLDPGLTVLETIDRVSPHLLLTQKRSILGAFLFSGGDVEKKVSVLSGGERSRLSLARMLVSPASLLLLDEPTNHLDMASREILAAALADYEGTLCAISHDRYFLDGIINRVWEVDHGTVREYIGNYSHYEWAKAREAETADRRKQENNADMNKDAPARQDKDRKRREAEDRNRRYRQLKPLQKKLSRVEARLETLMAEKESLDLQLADPAIYDPAEKTSLMNALDRKRELEREERDLLHRWEEFSTAIEEME